MKSFEKIEKMEQVNILKYNIKVKLREKIDKKQRDATIREKRVFSKLEDEVISEKIFEALMPSQRRNPERKVYVKRKEWTPFFLEERITPIQQMEEIISDNYQKNEADLRINSVRAIEFLPGALSAKNVIRLAILTQDENKDVRFWAERCWKIKDVKNRSRNRPKKEIEEIIQFIDNWKLKSKRAFSWDKKRIIMKRASIKLIETIPEKYIAKYLAYIAISQKEKDYYLSKTAEAIWNSINPEKWTKWISRKRINKIARYIRKNWNSKNWKKRYASVMLIKLLPENKAIDYLLPLAILMDDENPKVEKIATNTWHYHLEPEKWAKKYPLEKFKKITEYIDKNWNSKDKKSRMISLRLIRCLPEELFIDYIPHLMKLTFDEDDAISSISLNHWESINAKEWKVTHSIERANKIMQIIEKNQNSSEWKLEVILITLIGILPIKIGMKYLPYLERLAQNEIFTVSSNAKKVLERFRMSKIN